MSFQRTIDQARKLIRKRDVEQAIQVLRRECQLQPDSGPLRYELASALFLAGRVSEATDTYFELYEDGFTQPIVLAGLAASLLDEGRVAEAIAGCRQALAEDPHLLFARSNLLFSLCFAENIDPIELFQEHCSFGDMFPVPDTVKGPRQPGRFRIGYLSAWFKFHPVGRYSLPVIKNLNRDSFEVYCYHSGQYNDSITKRFREVTDHWRDISDLDDNQAEVVIRTDDLDVLIELDGHTGGNRLAVVARKPARRIATWLGYPNTTGVRAVDYRIVDLLTDPEPFSGPLHVERLFRLASPCAVFPVPSPSPPVSVSPVLTNGFVTFGAFGQIPKHSDAAVDAISRVVLSLPDSRLVVRASVCLDMTVRDAVIKRFVSRGIMANRIDCGGVRNNQEYLSHHGLVDIMLDFFPYNGFTTTCESLWMGVPMVTLQGGTHRERVGSSLLTAAGYPELIAVNVEGYVNVARALAQDVPRLAKMRTEMRSVLVNSPLMDVPRFMRKFETMLLSIIDGDV
jgi:protein O-GlcNAc transferase